MKPTKPINIHHFENQLEAVVVGIAATIAVGILITFLVRLVLYAIAWRKLLHRKMVTLELTPPAFTTKTAYSNERLFDIISGIRNSRGLKDRLLLREVTMSYEIASTKAEGIKFLVRTEKRYARHIAQNIMNFLPEIKIKEVTHDIKMDNQAKVVEFKQTGAWFLPFMHHGRLDQHDPAVFLAGAMSKLEDQEYMGLQLVVTPVKMRKASEIAYKVSRNENVTSSHGSALAKITKLINIVLFGVLDLVGEAYHGPSRSGPSPAQKSSYNNLQVAKGEKPARSLSSIEQDRNNAVNNKLTQPLFRVSIRVLVSTADAEATETRLASMKSTLAAYEDPSYQGLKPRLAVPYVQKYRQFTYKNGLPSLLKRHNSVLSSSEIASLYHFPIGSSVKVDNLNTSLSRTLPAPISLKQKTDFDIILGENKHQGVNTLIGLTEAERERHVYIIGGTGNGKTTMLQYAMVQDIKNGKGIAVVDPHGDLAETILKHIPENRIDDVIYFNPDDFGYPLGLNLLELPEGIDGEELLREKDLITETVVSVFRKIFSEDDSGGHRIEYVLRNTVQTALTIPNATIFTIFRLLTDAKYRKSIAKGLDNEDLQNFWDNELGKAGEFQRVKMSAGITAKVGRFLFSSSARRILEQPKSTIDFDDIVNSGKILICNFSKGLLGEDTSSLFGITILAKIQLATLRRARQEQTTRKPFYLYADEFQNFATEGFVQMLSEARKYRLFLLMAEQSTSQQREQRTTNIILANVGTIICFRSGNPIDERLLLPMFAPFIKESEIAYLPSYNFYMRIAAIKSQEPLSGETLLLKDSGSNAIYQKVIDASRIKFGYKPPQKNDKTKQQQDDEEEDGEFALVPETDGA